MTDKIKIRVFPDFCSSGLWQCPHGANLDESQFEGVLSPEIMIALKYWHHTWEMVYDYEDNKHRISKAYQEQWEQDGTKLVEAMNAYQDKYEFEYKGDNW